MGALVCAACGAVANEPGSLERVPDDGGERASSQQADEARPSAARVPQKHRPAGATCDRERPPGDDAFNEDGAACAVDADCSPPEGSNMVGACVESPGGARCAIVRGECLRDADCDAGDSGRCHNNREVYSCSYDTCYSDATCATGGPCACEGESGSPGNTCLPGNCQTDADCGSGAYCSPTQGSCGSYAGVIGYYCHTPQDTCVDDADCVDAAQGIAGYCMYSPELAHWACGYGQCVG